MPSDLYAAIMVGGAGTRLWPRSRRSRPKQMMRVGAEKSLLEQAYDRALAMTDKSRILLVTTAAFHELVSTELPDLPEENVVAEPEGRDTAACVGLAALLVQARNEEAVMAVLPADHLISPVERFSSSVHAAYEAAKKYDCLVTTGIVPQRPATGYGYIHRGEFLQEVGRVRVYRLLRFHEKPDASKAQEYLDSGEFYWNSGIFVWKASVILDEFRKHMPEHAAAWERLRPLVGKKEFVDVLREEYPELPKTSIDFGIMEKAENVAVVEAIFDWDDVGSWTAVADHLRLDEDDNAVEGDFLGFDVKNSVILSEQGKLVAAVGISDMVVVDTPDALFLCPKSRDQEVKKIVEELRRLGRQDVL